MKIRKAVSVVLMLSFLVSYSNAVPIFCKHEKSKLNQCRADLVKLSSSCAKDASTASAELTNQTAKTSKCQESLAFAEGLNKGLSQGLSQGLKIGMATGAVVVALIGCTWFVVHH